MHYKGHLVERMARVQGDGEAHVNYRHVIGSLVRKPGAFARYRFREQLFPTMEATVDSALSLLLEAGQPFDYPEVRDLAEPKLPQAPVLVWSGKPDLKVYDRLLTSSLAAAGVCG